MFEPGEKVELLPERHSGVIYHGLTYTVQEYCDVTDTCVVTNGEYTTPNVPAEYLGLVHETTQSINNEQVDLNKKFCEAVDKIQGDMPHNDEREVHRACRAALDAIEKSKDLAPSTESAFKHGLGRGYKDLAIQPMRLSHENKLNACQHTAIKYIMGYNLSGGKGRQDLEKAKHTIDLLLELENL